MNSLRNEIKLFGGDESDLKLLEGLESDDEFEEHENSFVDSDLLKDIAKYVKEEFVKKYEFSDEFNTEEEEEVEEIESNQLNQPNQQQTIKNTPKTKPINDIQIKKQPTKNKNSLEIDNTLNWFDLPCSHLIENGDYLTTKTSIAKLEQLTKKAEDLYNLECSNYEKSYIFLIKVRGSSSSEKDFVSTVLKSGTTSDRVSALTILIQESPLHCFKHLKALFYGMAKKKSRREAIMAIDSIKDLLIGNILPNRKLRYFRDCPILSKSTTSANLISWYFEDSLKKLYFEFIQLIEVFCLTIRN